MLFSSLISPIGFTMRGNVMGLMKGYHMAPMGLQFNYFENRPAVSLVVDHDHAREDAMQRHILFG
jgi:hypothetical protein